MLGCEINKTELKLSSPKTNEPSSINPISLRSYQPLDPKSLLSLDFLLKEDPNKTMATLKFYTQELIPS